MGIGLLIVWTALLLGPTFGIILARIAAGKSGGLRRLVWISSGCLVFVVAADYLGLRTSFALANLIFWVAAFLSICAVSGAIWTIERKPIRIALGILSHLIFVPGYILGTIGILGLMFIMADYLEPPQRISTLQPGLSCEVMGWGNATSQSGYDVSLYRYLPFLPLIRLKVASITVNQSNTRSGRTSADCESVGKEFGYLR
jgi:hypothetical protein